MQVEMTNGELFIPCDVQYNWGSTKAHSLVEDNLQSQPLKAKHLDQIERNKGQVVKCESHGQSKTTTVEPHTA